MANFPVKNSPQGWVLGPNSPQPEYTHRIFVSKDKSEVPDFTRLANKILKSLMWIT